MAAFKNPRTYVWLAFLLLVGVLGYVFIAARGGAPEPVVVALTRPSQALKATPSQAKESPSSIVSLSGKGAGGSQAPRVTSGALPAGRHQKPAQKPTLPVRVHEASTPAPPQAGVGQGALSKADQETPSQAHPALPTLSPSVEGTGGPGPSSGELPASQGEGTSALGQTPQGKNPSPSAGTRAPAELGGVPPQGAPSVASGDASASSVAAQPAPLAVGQKPAQIALLLLGLGRREDLLSQAVSFPREVALGFYVGKDTLEAQKQAQTQGYETFVMLPMEPLDYPQSDPGTLPLLTGIPAQENLARLETHLEGRLPCTGAVPFLGSRFMFSEPDLKPVLQALHTKGLIFMDTGSAPQSVLIPVSKALGMPSLSSTFKLGGKGVGRQALEAQLVALEKEARLQGTLLVYAQARTATLFCLEEWLPTLAQKNLTLVSLSTLSASRKAKT